MSLSFVEWGYLAPAFVAGLLVLATHVPLGREVLRRGIVFLDLAIAQIAGLGGLVAHAIAGPDAGWTVQLGAATAAAAGALLLRWLEGRSGRHQEAVIGVAFAAAACLSMLLMAHDPHGAEHLQDLFVGQILWTTWADLIPLALFSACALALWFGAGVRRSPVGFYLLFALTITASVQVVGVYLVFASLIVPALAASGRLLRAYALGAVGYALGLFASGTWDWPAGAAIVVAMILVAAAVAAMLGDGGSRDAQS
ncbi:MAG: hypothetical protein AMXMBFR6_11820 [Betaproteobacteria bacterium]|nr:metal ABC transporter permease [Rhodocyclaceae bacterium]MCG3185582.1 hypothetical protein [Rhodocyclaceae bacterium]